MFLVTSSVFMFFNWFSSSLLISDHNRLVSPAQTTKPAAANSPKSQTKTRPSPPQIAPASNTNNNNNNTTVNNNSNSNTNGTSTPPPTLKTIPRNGTIILDKPCPKLQKKAEALANEQESPANELWPQAPPPQPIPPNLVDISLLNHANKGVEALGVLVQYLVFNVSILLNIFDFFWHFWEKVVEIFKI